MTGVAQSITFSSGQLSLGDIFREIEAQTNRRFVYSEDEINTKEIIEVGNEGIALNAAIDLLSNKTNVKFTSIEDYYVVTADQKSKRMLVQKVRGKVVDMATGETLVATTIYVADDMKYSTITDENGEFMLPAPIGRTNLVASFVGYKTQVIPILINSGEEPYLTLNLEPSVTSLKTVQIEADKDKARTENLFVYGSGRGFSVMEANRYAGTLGDPARMARSYAGVIPARDDRNDIIIRGNSPIGIQWRLDDIEIPNPNHYGGIGLTGNTTTLLNMNLLDNSDFLMGAFPSEYGNALSGVFDLKTKSINPKKRQYRFQTGWNGFELGAEGPFSKQNPFGTYSVTYRYSFLDVVDAIGIDFGILPKFQDVTGKFDFKLSPKTELSVLGIWGTSFIELDDRTLREDDPGTTGEYLKTGSDIGLAGVSLKHRLSKTTVLKTGINVIDNTVKTEIDTFNFATDASRRVFTDNSGEIKYAFYARAETNKGKRRMRYGIKWDTYQTDYNSTAANGLGSVDTIHKNKGSMHLLRAFAENEYLFTDRFRLRAGLHGMYFLYNFSSAFEPRAALRYSLKDNQFLSFSYGNHHMIQPRTIYFVETPTANGSVQTNKDLDFSSAHHWTLTYDNSFSEHFRFKSEAYFQYLYDVPVEQNGSSFSFANVGAAFYIPQQDSLVNEGAGRNYGVELTLERFLDRGYYFMVNAALFRSEYKTLDDVWRSTAFDMKYSINAVGGYEKWINPQVAFGFDAKFTYAGGKPFTPVDEALSIQTGEVVLDESQAFSRQFADYFRTDVKIYYRINYKKVFTEFAVDFQNLTNQKNVYAREFSPETGDYRTFYHMSFFPMATFRCLF